MNMATFLTLVVVILFAALVGSGYLYAEFQNVVNEATLLLQENLRLQSAANQLHANCQQQLEEAQATIELEQAHSDYLREQLVLLLSGAGEQAQEDNGRNEVVQARPAGASEPMMAATEVENKFDPLTVATAVLAVLVVIAALVLIVIICWR
jgi:uncharacterized iron-regulated membrane protein